MALHGVSESPLCLQRSHTHTRARRRTRIHSHERAYLLHRRSCLLPTPTASWPSPRRQLAQLEVARASSCCCSSSSSGRRQRRRGAVRALGLLLLLRRILLALPSAAAAIGGRRSGRDSGALLLSHTTLQHPPPRTAPHRTTVLYRTLPTALRRSGGALGGVGGGEGHPPQPRCHGRRRKSQRAPSEHPLPPSLRLCSASLSLSVSPSVSQCLSAVSHMHSLEAAHRCLCRLCLSL